MIIRKSALYGLLPSAVAGVFVVAMAACSSDSNVAGNSAEIGNPEFASISGTLTLAGGGVAAKTSVRCIPEDFNIFKDTLPERWETTTDSNGFYSLDSLPETFAIEANSSNGEILLKLGLSKEDSTYSHKLSLPGTLILDAGDHKNGDTLQISIPGTTFLREIIVKNGQIAIDSLPASEISTIRINKDSVEFEEPIKIIANGHISLVIETEEKQDSVQTDTIVEPLQLQFKYSLAGLDIENTVTQVPIALRLGASDIDFEQVSKTNGAWVAKRGKTMLKLDKSYFNAEREQAVFWVLLDTLKANSKDSITLSFSEGTSASAPGVFSKNFIAAWHFDEGTETAIDVANLQNGTPYNVVDTTGSVGAAYYYNGKSSYVDIEQSCSAGLSFDMNDTMSISVWAKVEDISTSRFVLGKGSTQFHLKYFASNEGWLFERYETKTDTIAADTCKDCTFNNTWRHWYRADSTAKANEWAMLTIVQQAEDFKLYLNGILADDSGATGYYESKYYDENDFVIGRQEIGKDTTGQYFKGIIDELFVQRIPADADRIKVMYENQKPEDYWPRLK